MEVGKKYRVVNNLAGDSRANYNGFSVSINGDMVPYSDKVVTVLNVYNSTRVQIVEDGGRFFWCNKMLQEIDYKDYLNESPAIQSMSPQKASMLFNTKRFKKLDINKDNILHLAHVGSSTFVNPFVSFFNFNKRELDTEILERLYRIADKYFNFYYVRGYLSGFHEIPLNDEWFDVSDPFLVGYYDGKGFRQHV